MFSKTEKRTAREYFLRNFKLIFLLRPCQQDVQNSRFQVQNPTLPYLISLEFKQIFRFHPFQQVDLE
jgi:hypothetical protein